jgi:hypothetical protein
LRNGSLVTVAKRGSTVPTKFRLYACGVEICTDLGAGMPTLAAVYNAGAAPVDDPTISDSGTSNDNGTAFRYSGTCGVDGTWIYNASTKTGYYAGNTYKFTATPNDGTKHDAFVSIK